MHTLLRLPFALLELALRDGLSLARTVLRLVQPAAADDASPPLPRPAPRPDPAAPPPVRADAAMQRSRLDVMAPWKGYEVQSAADIVARVRGADEATKAVVLLYEQGHKGRATVLKAARA